MPHNSSHLILVFHCWTYSLKHTTGLNHKLWAAKLRNRDLSRTSEILWSLHLPCCNALSVKVYIKGDYGCLSQANGANTIGG